MARVGFILADDGEDAEFRQPFETLRQHGHEPTVALLEAVEARAAA